MCFWCYRCVVFILLQCLQKELWKLNIMSDSLSCPHIKVAIFGTLMVTSYTHVGYDSVNLNEPDEVLFEELLRRVCLLHCSHTFQRTSVHHAVSFRRTSFTGVMFLVLLHTVTRGTPWRRIAVTFTLRSVGYRSAVSFFMAKSYHSESWDPVLHTLLWSCKRCVVITCEPSA